LKSRSQRFFTGGAASLRRNALRAAAIMLARTISTSACATIAATATRPADAARENAPCLSALRLPLGAPRPRLGARVIAGTMNCSSGFGGYPLPVFLSAIWTA
jgi:hypothetical protein